MKIQIKNRVDSSIIFECEAESLKLAVELAVKSSVNLSRANLSGANLSGADLYGANLSGANLYGDKIDKCPLQIAGLKWWINITKKHIQIGCEIHTAQEWFAFTETEIAKMHNEALAWWQENKNFIKMAWEYHCEK